MKKVWITSALVLGVGTAAVLAGPDQEHMAAPVKSSAELEHIKNLAGRWEGTTQDGDGEPQPAAVDYKVTSGGSAVVETLFPGTPHEMVSVYHDVNGKLAMTHYCMLGNQPQLQLTGGDGQHIELSFADSPGIDAAKDQHMHALTLAWADPDHLTQRWSCYQDGKFDRTTTIAVSRAH